MDDELIACQACGARFKKDDLQRSCGNCFACTGCEIYVCAVCKAEIVVRPMRQIKKSTGERSGN
jgi:hypothetical protein